MSRCPRRASTTPRSSGASARASKGPTPSSSPIASAIEHIFGLCGTKVRYLEPDERPGIIGDYAVAAAKDCLAANDVGLDEVDLVICGQISRQYFEPATAMEVAAKLGLKRTHAFDVTAACVSHLEAIQTAAGYLALHPHYRTALVCAAELTGQFLSYDIQNVRELHMKVAGLTIGNAATALLLRRAPFPGGGIHLRAMQHLHRARSLGALPGADWRYPGVVVGRADAPREVHSTVGDRAAGGAGPHPERHRSLRVPSTERDHGAKNPG